MNRFLVDEIAKNGIVNTIKGEANKLTKIVGRIKILNSSPDVQKRKKGKITVVYLDQDDKRKTVTVNLNKNDYDKAIRAHERGYYVEIVGEMVYGKKLLCLVNRS